MPTAIVIQLKGLRDVVFEGSTGAAVHGFWFKRWAELDASIADRLHTNTPGLRREFTLSPLMELPFIPRQGLQVQAGTATWFRITTLTDWLDTALEEIWLPELEGSRIEISSPDLFEVTGIARTPTEHPWAGRTTYAELAEKHLFNLRPRSRWRLELATPTTFKNSKQYFPIPLPDNLARSWLSRWQAFAPLALPGNVLDKVRSSVSISSYKLHTRMMKEETRSLSGCMGSLRLQAHKLPPSDCAALDLLTEYAFYCGSGHKTAQGLGQTRVL